MPGIAPASAVTKNQSKTVEEISPGGIVISPRGEPSKLILLSKIEIHGSVLSRVRAILTASPPHSFAITIFTLEVSPGLNRLSPSVS
mgnify:CR=1 FL=1